VLFLLFLFLYFLDEPWILDSILLSAYSYIFLYMHAIYEVLLLLLAAAPFFAIDCWAADIMATIHALLTRWLFTAPHIGFHYLKA
jgi:hypothetical protein